MEIVGLDCGCGCGDADARTLEDSLVREPGVVHVFVNPDTEMAYVQYSPVQTGHAQLTAAVERAGLRVAEIRRH